MDSVVKKPDKAHGTWWLQHKAVASLITGYPVIVAHLEAHAAAAGSKTDAMCFKAYLKRLTGFKYVVHCLFSHTLLQPLTTLPCHIQGDAGSIDLLFALSSLRAFYGAVKWLATADTEDKTELSKLVNSVDDESNEASFKGIPLQGADKQSIINAFQISRASYTEKQIQCVHTS